MNNRISHPELKVDLKNGKLDHCTYEGSKIGTEPEMWSIDFFYKYEFVDSYMYDSKEEIQHDLDLIKFNIVK